MIVPAVFAAGIFLWSACIFDTAILTDRIYKTERNFGNV